ncbi:hypothetical protein PBRA_007344 [Plasmodiophora brassicae]|uniref:ABC transmembrane type-1 domain-containing protein n=1 Tax=Plasmodiophora brassicae TaxID=37360 RepID=A0A0G4IX51_PLABS|nr:hypothetical protein PBRA_007344 [Plasmodiophora brassicae]
MHRSSRLVFGALVVLLLSVALAHEYDDDGDDAACSSTLPTCPRAVSSTLASASSVTKSFMRRVGVLWLVSTVASSVARAHFRQSSLYPTVVRAVNWYHARLGYSTWERRRRLGRCMSCVDPAVGEGAARVTDITADFIIDLVFYYIPVGVVVVAQVVPRALMRPSDVPGMVDQALEMGADAIIQSVNGLLSSLHRNALFLLEIGAVVALAARVHPVVNGYLLERNVNQRINKAVIAPIAKRMPSFALRTFLTTIGPDLVDSAVYAVIVQVIAGSFRLARYGIRRVLFGKKRRAAAVPPAGPDRPAPAPAPEMCDAAYADAEKVVAEQEAKPESSASEHGLNDDVPVSAETTRQQQSSPSPHATPSHPVVTHLATGGLTSRAAMDVAGDPLSMELSV